MRQILGVAGLLGWPLFFMTGSEMGSLARTSSALVDLEFGNRVWGGAAKPKPHSQTTNINAVANNSVII